MFKSVEQKTLHSLLFHKACGVHSHHIRNCLSFDLNERGAVKYTTNLRVVELPLYLLICCAVYLTRLKWQLKQACFDVNRFHPLSLLPIVFLFYLAGLFFKFINITYDICYFQNNSYAKFPHSVIYFVQLNKIELFISHDKLSLQHCKMDTILRSQLHTYDALINSFFFNNHNENTYDECLFIFLKNVSNAFRCFK